MLPVNGIENSLKSDLPPLSTEDQTALASFFRRQNVIRDITKGCIAGHHTGAYICGTPGASKSYTVEATLYDAQACSRHHQRITAKPLYMEMAKNPEAIHVIEDCEQLLSEKPAQTLLRSALDSKRDRASGRRERRVNFSVSGSNPRVLSHFFSGALIFTTNRPLANEKPEIQAIMSRIPCVSFAPPNNEIRAMMRHIARQGHFGPAGAMTPHECIEVVEFVIQLAAELECPLDLRCIEHGYGHYLTHLTCGGSVDWRDMVKIHLMNTITYFDHLIWETCKAPGTEKAGEESIVADQVLIAQEIEAMTGLTRDQKLKVWESRTKLSRPTFYRRLEAGRTNHHK